MTATWIDQRIVTDSGHEIEEPDTLRPCSGCGVFTVMGESDFCPDCEAEALKVSQR